MHDRFALEVRHKYSGTDVLANNLKTITRRILFFEIVVACINIEEIEHFTLRNENYIAFIGWLSGIVC